MGTVRDPTLPSQSNAYSRPSRRLEHDANDIVFTLSQYWDQVDINRIPEQEMPEFVARYPAVGPAWSELKKKYRMYA